MVIQNFDVRTSAQRTAQSLQAGSMFAQSGPGNTQLPVQNAQLTESGGTASAAVAGREGHDRGFDFNRVMQAYMRSRDDSLDLLFGKKCTNRQDFPELWFAKKKGTPQTPKELKDQLSDMLYELLFNKNGKQAPNAWNERSPAATQSLFGENFNLNIFGNFMSSNFSGGAISGIQAGQVIYESEQVTYQAQGIVNTADGKTISVDINMHMSREFVSYMNINIGAGAALCDPLVINYGGTAASLLRETFEFDLTSNGSLEKLALLGEGSGFLALDKNGDGIINDGSELFGPGTGCGFSELKAYDKDNNNWIDEADEIFEKLVIWHRDKDGNDTYRTLKELGIGAIYLGNTATEFSFKGENNETLGIMRSISFFLKEDGGTGTVSHIDLAF